jgi:FkbM family methyltransferase
MKFDPFLSPDFFADFRASPFAIYDVGAAGGIYPLFPADTEALWCAEGFEPMPASFEKLKAMYAGSRNVRLHETALTDVAGSATFRVYPAAPTSSSLNANALIAESGATPFEVISVRCERLDDFCRGQGRPAPDFIKLDTEGTELNVLRGGAQVLAAHALGTLSEIKFIRFSDNTTTFAAFDQFLQDNGFILFDIQTSRMSRTVDRRFGGKKGPIDSAYVLYLRDFYVYHRTHLAGRPELGRAKLLKMLVLAVRFLYLDYAVELIDFGRSERLLTGPEADTLLRLYAGTADLAWKIPDFPGKQRLGLLVDFLSYLLHPEMKLAVPPMFNNLGNRRSALVSQQLSNEARILYPVRAHSDRAKSDLRIQIRP